MKVAEEFIRALYAIRDAILNHNKSEESQGGGDGDSTINKTYFTTINSPIGVCINNAFVDINEFVEDYENISNGFYPLVYPNNTELVVGDFVCINKENNEVYFSHYSPNNEYEVNNTLPEGYYLDEIGAG